MLLSESNGLSIKQGIIIINNLIKKLNPRCFQERSSNRSTTRGGTRCDWTSRSGGSQEWRGGSSRLVQCGHVGGHRANSHSPSQAILAGALCPMLMGTPLVSCHARRANRAARSICDLQAKMGYTKLQESTHAVACKQASHTTHANQSQLKKRLRLPCHSHQLRGDCFIRACTSLWKSSTSFRTDSLNIYI